LEVTMTRASGRAHIDAPAAEIWTHLIDLEAWPTWAAQFETLERLDAGPLGVGSRVRVKPRSMPSGVWTVTEFEEGSMFTWAASLGPDLRLIGGHELLHRDDGTDAEFWLEATGVLGVLLSPVLRRSLFARNTRAAAEGLKRLVDGA
jgi:hypothetical protein